MAGLFACLFSLLLLAKSLFDFSQSGPQLRKEVMAHYHAYVVFSLARLTLVSFLLSLALALPGSVAYVVTLVLFEIPYSGLAAAGAAGISVGIIVALQFCRVLHTSPGLIVASSHYAMHRFYGLWAHLSPSRLQFATRTLWISYGLWFAAGTFALAHGGAGTSALVLVLSHCTAFLFLRLVAGKREPPELPSRPPRDTPPNILMIGSDTLRADRLGFAGYRRALTPNLDRLADTGAALTQCYVPCARTAPSLVSMLTGIWPHHHGIRDNFVADANTGFKQPALPQLLTQAGYRTAAVSDWAGGDLRKFDLGFQDLDIPDDQWNLKFFLRQGPKDIRLFLSLFADNLLGKNLLEEIHYLAGVPTTRQIGLRARHHLHRLGSSNQPFLLNVFFASTHPPFASEYPYYTLFADPAYRGPSKFAMARLNDPFEIIRRQGEPKEEFDLDQIIDLYDGCVASFDSEVGHILDYLKRSGLARDTLVMIYSDHGMEFFEHDTWGQGNSAIGDFSARVPIILSGSAIPQPRRIDCVTRTVDIVPTVLDLLGLPQPMGLDGASLAPAIRGEPFPDLPAFYETGIWLTNVPGMPEDHLRYPDLLELLEVPDTRSGTLAIRGDYQQTVIAAKDRMIRMGQWKLVYQPLERGCLLKLYDIANDPNCRHNVFDAHAATAQELWTSLADWMAQDIPCFAGISPAMAPGQTSPIVPMVHDIDRRTDSPPPAAIPQPLNARVRAAVLSAARKVDDWLYEKLSSHTRILFVLSDGYGFACQAPVIEALCRDHPEVLVQATTDRGQALADIDFASANDHSLCESLHVPTHVARFRKWHMVVDTHTNAFYPARNALRVYMHHGPGFGIMGNKIAIIRQSDIFCGLSEVEREWFERLEPGIFNERRVFVPVGFPKNDALYRGQYDRSAILASLRLPKRRTILITSHWQTPSTLRRLNDGPFRELARAFPDANIIQTGHPWLWQPNHNIEPQWQHALLGAVHDVEAKYPNARFIQTADVESLLAVADLLVGDYSSVMTTYSLLDRPIVYFADPGFEFSIPALRSVFVNAAHTFSDLDGLLPACFAALQSPQQRAEGRAAMRATFFSNEGRSASVMAEVLTSAGRACTVDSPHWRNRFASLAAK